MYFYARIYTIQSISHCYGNDFWCVLTGSQLLLLKLKNLGFLIMTFSCDKYTFCSGQASWFIVYAYFMFFSYGLTMTFKIKALTLFIYLYFEWCCIIYVLLEYVSARCAIFFFLNMLLEIRSFRGALIIFKH